MVKKKNDYESDDIVILEGLSAVRKRPGMYIGGTDQTAINHLAIEIIDNAIDEATAGYGNSIKVSFRKDGSIEVRDNGRGVPFETHTKYQQSSLEIVCMKLHAGGKFNDKIYKTSAGLHGVGLAVVNALTKTMTIKSFRDGKVASLMTSRGKIRQKTKILDSLEGNGTFVSFIPDEQIFGKNIEISKEAIRNRLRYLVYLNKNLTIYYSDEESSTEEKFCEPKGITAYVEKLNESKFPLTDIHTFEDKDDVNFLQLSFQWNKGYEEDIRSYVNNIETEDGTHLTGLRNAFTRVISQLFNKRHENKKEKIDILGKDIREGLCCVLNLRIPDPQFEGQTKRRIGNRNLAKFVSQIITIHLGNIFSRDKTLFEEVLNKVQNAAISRITAKQAVESFRTKAYGNINVVASKLAECSLKDPEKTELYIVEGESAGGSAKTARDRKTQAVLPLRGKILNVERSGDLKMFANQEIKMLMAALGCGIGEDLDLTKLRYHKIFIMTDADVDGSHIRTLLLTFFYRYMRALVENGNICIAMPPLYSHHKGGKVTYIHDEQEMRKNESRYAGKLKRYKGLGEMDADVLWDSTMSPTKRKYKVMSLEEEDRQNADSMITLLMGKEVSGRKSYILSNYDEANVDI